MYYLKTQRLQNSNHYVYQILKSDAWGGFEKPPALRVSDS